MKKIYAFTLLLASALLSFDAAASVIFFQHINFEGPGQTITSDWHYTDNLAWNDQISSIHVPKGWKVVVYEHDFSGYSMTLTSDWSASGTNDFWNDRISSIEVIPPAQDPCYHGGNAYLEGVTIFEHTHFYGAQLTLTENIASLSNYQWNDVISSIEVPHGWTVVLHEHDDFRGRTFTITSNWTARVWNDRWNDRISSIEVIPPVGYGRW